MEISGRNQLKGQVRRVKSGTVMAEVEVKIKAARSWSRSRRALSSG